MAKQEKELIVKTKNKVGALAEITKVLAKAKVNLKALNAYEQGDQAIFYLVPNNIMVATQKLKELGCEVTEEDVVATEIADRVGALAEVANKLATAGVDIKHIYVTASGKEALVVIATKDNAKALEVLA